MAKKDFNLKNASFISKQNKKNEAEIQETMESRTKDALQAAEQNPNIETISKANEAVLNDNILVDTAKKKIMDTLTASFLKQFTLGKCPKSLAERVTEARFLAQMTESSFILLAERLYHINEEEQWKEILDENGEQKYSGWIEFLENEIQTDRTKANRFINIFKAFGVNSIADIEEKNGKLEPTKLYPYLPIINKLSKDEKDTEREKVINQALNGQSKSIVENQKEVQVLKKKYGLRTTSSKPKIKLISKGYKSIKLEIGNEEDFKKVMKILGSRFEFI